MSPLAPNETLVKEGTFLYDGIVVCDVLIVHSPIRYGSGDHEDPPEIYNDLERDTFYIYYGSTTERGRYNAGGGGYPSLEEAMAGAVYAPGIGRSVTWKEHVSVEG